MEQSRNDTSLIIGAKLHWWMQNILSAGNPCSMCTLEHCECVDLLGMLHSMVRCQNGTYFVVVKMVHCEHKVIIDNVNLLIKGPYIAA